MTKGVVSYHHLNFSNKNMVRSQKCATLLSRQLPQFNYPKRFNLYHHKCTQQSQQHKIPSFYSSILKKINNPTKILQLHAQIIISGATFNNVYLLNNLMNAYISNNQIYNAHKVFDQIPDKNIVSWTILISGYSKRGLFYEAFDVFCEMLKNGLLPNEVTMSSILPVIGKLGAVLIGKEVHCYWVRRGILNNVVVETCLIDMYGDFGFMGIARKVFDEMPVRNIVSWNVVLSGYASNGMCDDALCFFELMRKNGVCLDYYTVMSLILALSGPSEGRIKCMIHGFVVRVGYSKERQVQTALIDMYTSYGFVDEAYCVFGEMDVKDMVALTLMLNGFSNGQYWEKAMEVSRELMSVHYMCLDSTALVSLILSCSDSGALARGMLIHALVMKRGFNNDVFVGSSLISMYSNCADMDSSKKYFTGMEIKDVTCWNALISAMGVNGNGLEVVGLLWRMEELGFNPNESTFVSVLSACSHAGMVSEGLQVFYHMIKKCGIVPNLQHYACLVDLLGRSGQLDEAHLVISQMPLPPHSEIYSALLSACGIYGNTKMGTEIYQQLLKVDLTDVGQLFSISNLHSSMGNWEGKEMTDRVRRSKGLMKDPGYSVIS